MLGSLLGAAMLVAGPLGFGAAGSRAQAQAPTRAQVPIQAQTPAQAPAVGGSTLPLPRFVTLRAGEANLRTGPGVQYPVEWVYRRKNIPLEVIAEFETWRKVRDWQGAQGWLHQSMLESKRTAVVTGLTRSLRAKMDANSPVVAEVDVDAVGRVIKCPDGTGWCKLLFNRHEGWLRRVEIWGVYPDEEVR